MSEQENNNDNDIEIIEEIPQQEVPIKTKKQLTPEKLEQLKQARLKGAEKKKEMKELKTKAKQLPIEEVKLSAMKYDELQKRKEDFIKAKEEIVMPKEEKPKITDKKKRVIKKIVYEDGSEDEIEDVRHTQQQQQPKNKHMTMFSNDDSYSNLVYQSACDRLKEKLQDERTKYLISSLMPNYG